MMARSSTIVLVFLGLALSACGSTTGGGGGTNDRPVISSFTASPASISDGQSTTLSWNVTGATTLTLNPGGVDVSSTTSHEVSPQSTTIYTLSASSTNGSTQRITTVTVGSSDASTVTVNRIGHASMNEMSMPQFDTSFVMGLATFTSLSAPQTVTTDMNAYVDSITGSCFVASEGILEQDPIPVPEGTYLHVGSSMTVSADGSTYATLTPRTELGVLLYQTDATTPVAAPLPQSMSITIPGNDQFPAFTNAPFPDTPSALALTAPTDTSSVTKDTTFTWNAGASSNSITFFGGGTNALNENVMFFCHVKDTGAFTFPTETKAALDAKGFTTGTLIALSRSTYRLHIEGDTALYLTTMRSIDTATVVPASGTVLP